MAARCRAGCSAMAWSATGSLGCNPYCLRQLETEDILRELSRSEARPDKKVRHPGRDSD